MKTLHSRMLASLVAVLLIVACGPEPTDDGPSHETVARKLDDTPREPRRETASHPAELSPDGSSYCAVGNPKLCAPARQKARACRDDRGNSHCQWGPCVCCEWQPMSWPFVITCDTLY